MKAAQIAPNLEEGQAAFERFSNAVKAVLRVPKSALPPRPTRKLKEKGH